jgi:hypothetical protein
MLELSAHCAVFHVQSFILIQNAKFSRLMLHIQFAELVTDCVPSCRDSYILPFTPFYPAGLPPRSEADLSRMCMQVSIEPIMKQLTCWCCLFISMWWDCVSELWPVTGLLYVPRMICESGDQQWNDIDSKNQRTQRKTCLSATLSTTNTNPTWAALGVNPDLHC